MKTRKAAVRRSMLWSAYGDALGFITETRFLSNPRQSASEVPRVTALIPWTRRVGGQFGVSVELPSGCYSDDTQLRLATARSIGGNGIFDVESFSKIEIPIWTSYALGAGRSSKVAAESLKKRQIQWNSNFYDSRYSQYIRSGGNGTAMRIQPHVWCAQTESRIEDILKDVIRNTVTTHGHSRAIVGAAFHAMCLHKSLFGLKVPDPSDWRSFLDKLNVIPEIIRMDEELRSGWLQFWERSSGQTIDEAVRQALDELKLDVSTAEHFAEASDDRDRAGMSYTRLVTEIGCFQRNFVGSAPKTALLAAYLSHLFQDRVHDGLLVGTNLFGSDTDTISTMAGAIMGLSADHDPPEEVLDAAYVAAEAERLADIGEGRDARSHPYPDLLYWEPPASQIDALGRYDNQWVVQGLGYAEPLGNSIGQSGRAAAVWQWFKLSFGQTVLLRRRPTANTLTEKVLPIEPRTRDKPNRATENVGTVIEMPLEKHATRQPQLWDRSQERDVTDTRQITLDDATDLAIRSQFKNDIVGSMLVKLASQEDGIEKSIAFAAIVAKARQARLKHEKKSSSSS